MDLTGIIRKGEKQFVALCPELDVVSQGTTIEKAVDNLKEAVEYAIKEGMLKEKSITTNSAKKPKTILEVVEYAQ